MGTVNCTDPRELRTDQLPNSVRQGLVPKGDAKYP